MDDVIRLDAVETYNRLFGLETLHPLVSVVDLSQATSFPRRFTFHYGVYALFLKETRCGDIRYGRQAYDYQEGTVTSFAPGQVASIELDPGAPPRAHGLLFHPDLVRGTSLGAEIKSYSFFAYSSAEALHLSDEERDTFMGCLRQVRAEVARPADKMSKRLIARHIQLLLDYCLRFYARQFVTRGQANRDVLVRFEQLLDDYFVGSMPRTAGLPTVKYFAEKVFLSPNYFGDLVKKETGRTAQEHIRGKIIALAKDMLASSDKAVGEIAYGLGFQYPQHLDRVFKKNVGCTPNEYRRAQAAG